MGTSSARPPRLTNREIAIAPAHEAIARALEQSEERFRRLASRAGIGVFRSTSDGRLIEVNPVMVRMLGYAREDDLLGVEMPRVLFVDPADCDRLRAQLLHGPVERASLRWRRNDGTCIDVRLSLRTVQDESTGETWCDGIVDDITERLREQELMRRTERMASLGATLAGVAHELNNPLAAILGFAQLLLKRETSPETRRALETIDHEAARAGKIVRDLLTLTRKREGERRVRVNLNDVVAYIMGTRRYGLETHGIACRTTLDPHLPLILGDRTQLEQVVLNLLNNAEQAIRSAGDGGGCVHIRTRRERSRVVLDVEDDGPGIPAAERERIWDPFWTTKSVGLGIGLGLTVVREIVANHGGEISAEDAGADGRGARFVLRFPGIYWSPLEGEPIPETASRPLDVLVVDADSHNANFLTAFLASRGHAALAVDDAEHAMRLATHLTFDAVICDAGAAGAGSALVDLRSTSGCCHARFVVAAGDPESTVRLPVPLPAAMSLVMRPYDLEELRILLEV
jgi:PAS domain S-box-containing protein